MPTARELLEQADALMRRNRAAALDDIPVLTDVVPVHGDRAPPPHAAEPPGPPAADAPAAPAAAGIPTLTERAPPGGPHEPPDSMLQQGGEPSDWLEFEGGESSIVGEAPDSVAIVPPVELVRASEEAPPVADEHEEIELTTPAEDAFDDEFGPRDVAPAPRTEAHAAEARTDAWLAPRLPETPVAPEPIAEAVPEPVAEAEPEPAALAESLPDVADAPAAPIDAAAAEPAAPAPEAAASPDGSRPVALNAAPVSAAGDEVDAIAAPTPTPSATAVPTLPDASEPPAPGPASALAAHPVIAEPEPAAATGVADDQPKWDAIAEEVRVQVLQRIDLFTDTGLRDQLGQRLRPIVDRASADLIATISLNVGELLRAYVAEAIEREIESWRRNH